MACSTEPPASSTPPPSPQVSYESTPLTSARSLKQLSIFAFGAACFLASTTITRRAVYRRSLRIAPKMFSPNTNPHEHFSPFHDALMALNLATMNCVSVGIMMVGGALWSVDVSGLNEMRSILRGRLGYDVIYGTEEESHQEAEESLGASILRKRQENANENDNRTPR